MHPRVGARVIVADSNPQTVRGTLEYVPEEESGGTQPASQPQPTPASNQSTGKKVNPFSTRVRVIQLTFLALAVVATICLAWWQWERWSSGGGSYQNLGYALQWPAFGLFFIIAYRKYMEYERERALGEEAPAVTKTSVDESPREIPQDVMDEVNHRRSGSGSTVDATAGTNPAFVDDRRRASRQAREASSANSANNVNSTDRTGTTDPR